MLSIRNRKARGAPGAGRPAPAGNDKRAPAGRDKRRLAGDRAPSATQPAAAAQPVASAEGTPSAAGDSSGNGQQRPSAATDGPRPGSRRALKNWRVRSRLLLLIAIPTVTAVMLGGIRIGSFDHQGAAAGVHQLGCDHAGSASAMTEKIREMQEKARE